MSGMVAGGDLWLQVSASLGETASAQKAPRSDALGYGLDYVYLCTKIMELTGIDLARYKPNQMHRRLSSFAAKCGHKDLYGLAASIQRDAGSLKHLMEFLTINVSAFFRNPEQWEILKSLLSPLARLHGKPVRAWSAGSSAGQEAYSVAMILREMGIRRLFVLATDIHGHSLAKGREGKYTEQEVAGVPEDLLVRHFVMRDGEYQVRQELRRCVEFREHNLLGSGVYKSFDLVLCRNVLIYLTEAGRDLVLCNLASSLKPGGLLFVGCTETLHGARKHGLDQIYPFFYRREGGSKAG